MHIIKNKFWHIRTVPLPFLWDGFSIQGQLLSSILLFHSRVWMRSLACLLHSSC